MSEISHGLRSSRLLGSASL